jgi:hypothetical protein
MVNWEIGGAEAMQYPVVSDSAVAIALRVIGGCFLFEVVESNHHETPRHHQKDHFTGSRYWIRSERRVSSREGFINKAKK